MTRKSIFAIAAAVGLAATAQAHEGHGTIDPASLLHLTLEHGGVVAVLAALGLAVWAGAERIRRRRDR
jgi:hypothetical protein